MLIDHNTAAGFEAIAEARQYLLDMGNKELKDSEADHWPIRGSHVVAPVSVQANTLDQVFTVDSVLTMVHVPCIIQVQLDLSVDSRNVGNDRRLFG